MTHFLRPIHIALATLALACSGQAWSQTPAGVPADAANGNTRKGVISAPVQPKVQPAVQPSTPPKVTRTWDHKRYQRKTSTGVITPAPAPAPQAAPAPKPGHGKCPPGLAKKNNGCQPPGHAK